MTLASRTPRMNLIVAVDSAFGIARENQMPWHLPKEYAHFLRETKTTSDPSLVNAVIMGRKCWESIPAKYRPLKDRINVVLSRTMERVVTDDFIVVGEFEEALQILTSPEGRFHSRVETIWNCGGKAVYELGLAHSWAHKLVLTRIENDYGCDLFFPEVEWHHWELNEDFPVEQWVEEKGVRWSVSSYTNKRIAIQGNSSEEQSVKVVFEEERKEKAD